MSDVDVSAKLTLQDGITAVLKEAWKATDDLAHAEKEAQETGRGWMREGISLAHELGFSILESAKKVGEFGASFVEAAADGNRADTALAGMIAATQGREWSSAMAEAESYGDVLDEIGISAGVAGDDLEKAFQVMSEITGASEEGLSATERHVEAIATISGVLGKSAEGLSREYSMATEGTIRMKSQLFQLLQPTGIFGDNAKKAGEYWSKLTDEQRIKLLDQGISSVAAKMGDAKPSFMQMETSLANVYKIAKEKLGEPFMQALSPILNEVIDSLDHMGPDVAKFAKEMGKDVGAWVKAAWADAKDAFQYLKDNQQNIADSVKEAWADAKAVVSYILANKDTISTMFEGYALAKAGGPLVNMMAKGGGMGAEGGSTASFAVSVAAFAAAVASLTWAANNWADLMKSTEGYFGSAEHVSHGQDYEAIKRSLQEQIKNPNFGGQRAIDNDATQVMLNNFEELGNELGKNRSEFTDLIEKFKQADEAAHDFSDGLNAFSDKLSSGAINEGQQDYEAQMSEGAEMFSNAFAQAMASGNQAQMQYVANILAGSTQLQEAMLQAGTLTAEGYDALATMVESKSAEFATNLRSIAGASGAAPKVDAAPKVNMSGGQTFKIQQDFRDQDPDRVAITFMRDIEKASWRRVQSGSSSPFGT